MGTVRLTDRISESHEVENPESFGEVTVQMVQPYQADKAYLCPGCHREIPEELGHLVVTPSEALDLRRHWHRGCWEGRQPRG